MPFFLYANYKYGDISDKVYYKYQNIKTNNYKLDLILDDIYKYQDKKILSKKIDMLYENKLINLEIIKNNKKKEKIIINNNETIAFETLKISKINNKLKINNDLIEIKKNIFYNDENKDYYIIKVINDSNS